MVKVRDVVRHIRSKNAGPYWVTFDLFFDGAENYRRFRDSPALSGALFQRLYDTDPAMVKKIAVDDLHILKISYPRATPQGGMEERDMHSGQQYVHLLDIELSDG